MNTLIITVLFLFAWAARELLRRRENISSGISTRNRTFNRVAAATMKGYKEITCVTGKPFVVRYWSRNYFVLPAKYLPDVRKAHREHLNFTDSISDLFFMYNWIGDLFKSSRMTFAVMRGINPQLPKLSNSLFEESAYAFEQELGNLDASREFVALELTTRISLRIMSRIIAGIELSRNEKFLDGVGTYFNGNFFTGFVMLNLPFTGRLRDIIAWPLWAYHQRFHQDKLLKMIEPVVAKRMDDHTHGRIDKDQFDAVTCTLNLLGDYPLQENGKYTPLHTLSHETLQLIWAAGQSPAMSVTTVMFKLLECPEYFKPILEQTRAAIDKHGWNDAIFNELPLMDSFIRETHRMYPAFALNGTRVVKGSPFTFSDGLTFPVGTRIAFPAEAIQRDPSYFEDPDSFDGFRFIKLAAADTRQEDGVNRWHASHSSFTNLTFGYGNHVCPGRFITIRLLKVILCRLLLQYEIEWDYKQGEPPRFVIEGASLPNVSQKVRIKKRTGA